MDVLFNPLFCRIYYLEAQINVVGNVSTKSQKIVKQRVLIYDEFDKEYIECFNSQKKFFLELGLQLLIH